ncbi:MAG: hypothetical protein WCS01_14330 [bacterium]
MHPFQHFDGLFAIVQNAGIGEEHFGVSQYFRQRGIEIMNDFQAVVGVFFHLLELRLHGNNPGGNGELDRAALRPADTLAHNGNAFILPVSLHPQVGCAANPFLFNMGDLTTLRQPRPAEILTRF